MNKSVLHLVQDDNSTDQGHYTSIVQTEVGCADLIYLKEEYPLYALRTLLTDTCECVCVVLGKMKELGIENPKKEDELELVRLSALSQSRYIPVIESFLRYLHEKGVVRKYIWMLAINPIFQSELKNILRSYGVGDNDIHSIRTPEAHQEYERVFQMIASL